MTSARTIFTSKSAVLLRFCLIMSILALSLITSSADAQFLPPTANQAAVVSARAYWSTDKVVAAGRGVLAVEIDIAPTYHINPNEQQIPESLANLIATELVTSADDDLITLGKVQYPPAGQVEVNYTGQPEKIAAYEGQVRLFVPMLVAEQASPGWRMVSLKLKYQACDHTQCLLPKTIELTAPFEIVEPSYESEPLPMDKFAGFDASAFARMQSGEVDDSAVGENLDNRQIDFSLFDAEFAIDASNPTGLILLLLLAATGGLLLNFTPCVLPVIPLKILALTRTAGNRGRSILLGAAMSFGLVMFWLALGVVMAVVSGFAATNQLFQYPAFTIGVGIFIALMAVAMTGLFAIPMPRFLFAMNPRHDTVVGSMLFGVMTAILSTPCTAPFMGSALGWATAQPASLSLVTFVAIGVGMALPYMVLSIFPQWVEKLPRSGPGSDLLKQVMGLFMLAAAGYFIGVGLTTVIAGFNYWLLVMIPIAAAGGWLSWRTIAITKYTTPRVISTLLGSFIIITSIFGSLTLKVGLGDDWLAYTPDRFEQAVAEEKIVVLDFTAEWCLNCKTLEHTVLNNESVVEQLTLDDVVAMKVDITTGGQDNGGLDKLTEVGRVSIPVLVIYNRAGEIIFNRDFYTTDQVLKAISSAGR